PIIPNNIYKIYIRYTIFSFIVYLTLVSQLNTHITISDILSHISILISQYSLIAFLSHISILISQYSLRAFLSQISILISLLGSILTKYWSLSSSNKICTTQFS